MRLDIFRCDSCGVEESHPTVHDTWFGLYMTLNEMCTMQHKEFHLCGDCGAALLRKFKVKQPFQTYKEFDAIRKRARS